LTPFCDPFFTFLTPFLAPFSDPLGNHTTTFDYNTQGDLEFTTDPLGNVIQRTHDAISRLVEIKDPKGFITKVEYDGLDRVIQITDARNEITLFGYDPTGNLESLTDGEGHETTFNYDPLGRLKKLTDALGRMENSVYDFNGNLIQFTDRKSQVTTFTYDPRDRQTSATYADGSTTTFTYDPVSNLIQVVDSLSGTISRTFDARDNLTQETTSQGSIVYAYDELNRRETMAVNGQSPVMYEYDNESQLTQVSQGTEIVGIGYDVAGRRESLTYSNGTSTTYTYDDESRLINLVHQGPTGSIENLTYTYDEAGNRNTSNRVNGVANDLPVSVQAAYDAANEQIQFNSGTPNLTYDGNGNLETQSIGTNTTSYTWNARNQLIAIDGPGLSASFTYDVFDRRTSKTVNGATTAYHYDDEEIVAEIKDGAIEAQYLNGLETDEKFVRQANSTEYFHVDAIGNVLALTDAAGTVETTYSYDPFGKTAITGASTNPFQYTGRENDETGTYYYRARYYSPSLQRFVSERGGPRNSDRVLGYN